jgi:hypothetical protein
MHHIVHRLLMGWNDLAAVINTCVLLLVFNVRFLVASIAWRLFLGGVRLVSYDIPVIHFVKLAHILPVVVPIFLINKVINKLIAIILIVFIILVLIVVDINVVRILLLVVHFLFLKHFYLNSKIII